MSNYIKPNTKIIIVSAQHIMKTVSGVDGLNFNPSDTTDGMDAKGGFLWDEDEDDDPMGTPSFDVWEE